MAIPLNPYVAGNPVGDSPAFIGRADVLREVLRVLRRSQDNAIVLYGQRRIGKTSILQHLATQLSFGVPYRSVYFDLQDKAAWPLGRVLQDLARSIAHSLGQPDPDLGPNPETTFRDEWLLAILGDLPEGCSLVLLFDEFDVLADPKAEQAATAFFPYLRELLTLAPQRLQFVFVIGRNVDDLDNIALSLFKGTPAQRVSLLDREDAAVLVHLSEVNDTLRWSPHTVERVWQLTHGHPFLTQQLCSHVWERAYDEEPDKPPTVAPADVDAAVPDALEASRNTLEWLWDGLPPAERVVASALAEAGPGPITQEKLERLLHESGVRVVIRELQNAPRLLQDWDLIEPSDSGYRFRVELLRRWIEEHKPLHRVQEELDRIEPVAENLYQAALGLYQSGQLEQAVALLRQATALNPNHVRANQLLADILLAQREPGEARQLLERLYEYQPAAARSRLVQALLAQAQIAESDDDQLTLYKRVLELDPAQPEAVAEWQRIWQKRGDTAMESDDLKAALEAYQEADLTEKVSKLEQEIRRRDLATRLQELDALEQEKQYGDALELARKLAGEYSEEKDWASDLERLERKTRLADFYQRALGALQSGDLQKAQTLLAAVIALEPGYEEATRYLHEAVTGVDVAELESQLEAEKEARKKAEAKARKEAKARRQREQDLKQLQAELETERKARQKAEADAVKKETVIGWDNETGEEVRIEIPTTPTVQKPPPDLPKSRWSYRASPAGSRPTVQKPPPDLPKPAGPRRLSPWNPLDHLRLLWWVLVTPQRLKAYRKAFGEKDERRMGKWLASTLIWLPSLILTLALGLAGLPRTRDAGISEPAACLWISLVLVIAWMLTGWLGESNNAVAVAVAAAVAGAVMGAVAISVTDVVAGHVAVAVAVAVALVGAGGMASVGAGGVAVAVAVAMAFVVGVGVVGPMADEVWNAPWSVLPGKLAVCVPFVGAFVVAVRLALGVASSVKESLKTGRPSWLARVASGYCLWPTPSSSGLAS